jgi:subtilase family protein
VKSNSRAVKNLATLLAAVVFATAFVLPMSTTASYVGVHQGNQATRTSAHPHAAGRVLIEFRQSPSESFWKALENRYGLVRGQRLDTFRSLREIAQELRAVSSDADISFGESCYAANLPNQSDALMEAVIVDLESQSEFVLKAQPDYIYEACQSSGSNVQPNDPLFSSMIHGIVRGGWALEWAHFPGAWRWGTSGATIAVLDGRADASHPDLQVDPRSQDCVLDGDPSVSDHGTSVAGIAGESGNNNTGGCGGAWNASLVCERVMNSANFVTTSAAVRSLNHLSTLPDVRVINMSWGGPAAGDSLLHDAIRAMRIRGVLFVGSAGNEGNNIDTTPVYPASWPEVIPVAMSDYLSNNLAPLSNWGRNCIGAPGGGFILTTKPNGGYDFFSGTSAAAPFVSAAASLLFSQGYSADEVEWRLKNSLEKPASLSQIAGEMNVEAAFMLQKPPLALSFDRTSYSGGEGDPINISIGVSDPTAQTVVDFGDGIRTTVTGSFNSNHAYPYGQYTARATATAAGLSMTVTASVVVIDKLDYHVKLKGNGKAVVSASSSQPTAQLILTINGVRIEPRDVGYWVKKGVSSPVVFVITSDKGSQAVVNK